MLLQPAVDVVLLYRMLLLATLFRHLKSACWWVLVDHHAQLDILLPVLIVPICSQSAKADKRGADASNTIRAIAEALKLVIKVGTCAALWRRLCTAQQSSLEPQ